MSDVQSVVITAACPSCGDPDYEFEFDSQEVARATEISVRCEDCGQRISVQIDVLLQSSDYEREVF